MIQKLRAKDLERLIEIGESMRQLVDPDRLAKLNEISQCIVDMLQEEELTEYEAHTLVISLAAAFSITALSFDSASITIH